MGAGRYAVSSQTAINKKYANENDMIYYANSVINEGESLLYAGGDWYDLSDPYIQRVRTGFAAAK